MTFDVLLAEPAMRDLSDIAHYVAVDMNAPAAALKLVERIEAAVLALSEMPTRHGLLADPRLADLGVRALQVDSYIAFYVASEENHTVTVIRILHGRRDWARLL